jgi:hypothetical protein
VFPKLKITSADILIPRLKCALLQFRGAPGDGVSDRQNRTGKFRDAQLKCSLGPVGRPVRCTMQAIFQQLLTLVDSDLDIALWNRINCMCTVTSVDAWRPYAAAIDSLPVSLQSGFSLYGWSITCKLQGMKQTEAFSTTLDRKNLQRIWRRLADWWCTQMHDSCMWPIHGAYRCATCGRRQPVPWAK